MKNIENEEYQNPIQNSNIAYVVDSSPLPLSLDSKL